MIANQQKKKNGITTIESREYVPNPIFENLFDILKVERFSEEKDGECFKTLAKVLKKHKLQKEIAITLLHTHFPVNDRELLIEKFDNNKQILTISPITLDKYKSLNIVPCSWRFIKDEDMKEVRIMPLQFCISDDNEDLMSTAHLQCFLELAEVLRKFNALIRFGVCFAKNSFDLKANEVLIEYTYIEDREQVIEVSDNNNPLISKYIETSWVLDVREELVEITNKKSCSKKTETWCSRYCQSRCAGTNWSHDDEHTGARHTKQSQSVHYS